MARLLASILFNHCPDFEVLYLSLPIVLGESLSLESWWKLLYSADTASIDDTSLMACLKSSFVMSPFKVLKALVVVLLS